MGPDTDGLNIGVAQSVTCVEIEGLSGITVDQLVDHLEHGTVGEDVAGVSAALRELKRERATVLIPAEHMMQHIKLQMMQQYQGLDFNAPPFAQINWYAVTKLVRDRDYDYVEFMQTRCYYKTLRAEQVARVISLLSECYTRNPPESYEMIVEDVGKVIKQKGYDTLPQGSRVFIVDTLFESWGFEVPKHPPYIGVQQEIDNDSI